MARERNSEILKRNRDNLELAKKFREKEKYDDLWRRLVDLYHGRHHTGVSKEDRLLVNMAFATINVIAPSVSINNPKISVNARKFEQADQAVLTEAIVNYWWRVYNCQKEFRRAVQDFLIVGFGFIKTGYRFVEEDAVLDENPDFDSYDDLTTPDSVESNVESALIIKEDRPFTERVSPHDVFVDPDGKTMDDIRWIAQRTRRPLEDVKTDKRYKFKSRTTATSTYRSEYSDTDIQARADDPSGGTYVEVWEYYDIDRGMMSIFCDGSDDFLVAPIKIPFSFGHPFVMLRNYEVPEVFYTMGELEAIEPLQRELNDTRSQMMNHRKRYSRKGFYKPDAFNKAGIEALQSDEDNVMVAVQSDGPISDVFAPMPAVITPPEFYNQSDLISGDIDRVSGISEYMRGGVPEGRRTATEAGIIQDSTNARASEKLGIIEKSIAEVARRLIMLAQQYMTGEQTIRVVGSEGVAPAWLDFSKEYIQGEFDFEVEAGSTAPVNESFKRQMAMQVMQAMAPFASAGVVDMTKLATYILETGFGIRNAQSFVIQQGPPGQPGQPQGPGGPGGPPPGGPSQGAPQGALPPGP